MLTRRSFPIRRGARHYGFCVSAVTRSTVNIGYVVKLSYLRLDAKASCMYEFLVRNDIGTRAPKIRNENCARCTTLSRGYSAINLSTDTSGSRKEDSTAMHPSRNAVGPFLNVECAPLCSLSFTKQGPNRSGADVRLLNHRRGISLLLLRSFSSVVAMVLSKIHCGTFCRISTQSTSRLPGA